MSIFPNWHILEYHQFQQLETGSFPPSEMTTVSDEQLKIQESDNNEFQSSLKQDARVESIAIPLVTANDLPTTDEVADTLKDSETPSIATTVPTSNIISEVIQPIMVSEVNQPLTSILASTYPAIVAPIAVKFEELLSTGSATSSQETSVRSESENSGTVRSSTPIGSTSRRSTRIERATTPLRSNTPASSMFGESDEDNEQHIWRRAVLFFLKDILKHRYAPLFSHPVREEDAPGYRKIVKHPIDLSVIRRRIEENSIQSVIELRRDLALMFLNALMFNREDYEVYDMVVEMKEHVDRQLELFIGNGSAWRQIETTSNDSSSTSSRRSSRSRLSLDTPNGPDIMIEERDGTIENETEEAIQLRPRRPLSSPAQSFAISSSVAQESPVNIAANVKRRRL